MKQDSALRIIRTLVSLLQDLEEVFEERISVTEQAVAPPPQTAESCSLPPNPTALALPHVQVGEKRKRTDTTQSRQVPKPKENPLPGGGIDEVHRQLASTVQQLLGSNTKLNRQHLKEAGFKINFFKYYPELTQLFRQMKKKYNPQLNKFKAGSIKSKKKARTGNQTCSRNPSQTMTPCAEQGPPPELPDRVPEASAPGFSLDESGLIFTLPFVPPSVP